MPVGQQFAGRWQLTSSTPAFPSGAWSSGNYSGYVHASGVSCDLNPRMADNNVVLNGKVAGGTFAEKAGCYVNADDRLQYAEAALPPRDGSLPDLDLFAILLGRPGGPARSREVLAELAATIPAFSAAEGGVVPAFGLLLGEAQPVGVGASATRFSDPWTQPRFDRGDRPGEPSPKGGANA